MSLTHARAHGVIPVWALGETRPMSERERKLTSAVYAQNPAVLEHVRREGRLPRSVPGGGREIGLRVLVRQRGLDLHLTEPEREIYGALVTDGDAPGGRAVLLGADDHPAG
jgi:hypothetical protein